MEFMDATDLLLRKIKLNFLSYKFMILKSANFSHPLLLASSNAEVLTRKHEEKYSPNASKIKGRTPVAIIKKNSGQKGTLACTIPWGKLSWLQQTNSLLLICICSVHRLWLGLGHSPEWHLEWCTHMVTV